VYSYAYDDDATFTFCPSTASAKESDPKLAFYNGNWRVGSL
jgi:hypothetical protein